MYKCTIVGLGMITYTMKYELHDYEAIIDEGSEIYKY